MSKTAISQVHAWEALDSRGRPTVACRVTLAGGGAGRAVVPSGASMGGHEARERRDGGTRYGGFGVHQAVANVHNVIAPLVLSMDAADRAIVDAAIESADSDPALGTLGANAVLAVSLAVTLAFADELREPLWRTLSGSDSPLIPMPMVNIISGGAHARGALDIQDVLAIPLGASNFAESIEWVSRVRAATARLMEAQGVTTALVADEGGLAGALGNNEQALSLVAAGIAAAGLEPGQDVAIAVDFASNQMWTGNDYRLKVENCSLTADEWVQRIAGWCAKYPIVSLEDVLQEDDWAGWSAAKPVLGTGRQLLGDDHFATNVQRVEKGIAARSANAVLVKPNQAGTVTRAEQVVTTAHAAGFATVVSARSGDTEDHWLADFAIGWNAGQIKVGSTMRSERTAKWNRVLEIESEAGSKARFAGRSTVAGL